MLSAYQKISFKSAKCVADGFDRLGLTRLYAASLLIGRQPDPFDTPNNLAEGHDRGFGSVHPGRRADPGDTRSGVPAGLRRHDHDDPEAEAQGDDHDHRARILVGPDGERWLRGDHDQP